MKHMLTLIAAICSITLLFSCKKEVGKGPVVTEVRNTTGFNRISLAIPATLVFEQKPGFFFEIKGQQNILDLVTTSVSNNELRIRFRDNIQIKRHEPIVIKVQAPSIESLLTNGSGNIQVPGTITTNAMWLSISGSGNISIDSLRSGSIDASISGSGDIAVSKGWGTQARQFISGSGNINMENVDITTVDAQISGSGTIRVKAAQNLQARISGSGSIYYRGNPLVNAYVSGSGRVIKL